MQQTTSGSCFQSNAAATVNNQLVGYTYDAPGNLIKNSGTTYFYDDENRLIQVNGTLGNCSTAAQCYSYDAMGRRTEKLGGSTWNDRIYDLSNQVVAQATAGGGAGAYIYFNGPLAVQYTNSTTYFVQTDQLGSTRTMTCFASGTTGCSASQAVYDSMDYLPFGEQIAGDGGTIHKFTGKERDAESGLDNFGARYNASTMGRFMTPDPIHIMKQKFLDPQQWNMYAYVRNNPLRFVDPTGKYLVNCGNGDKKCNKAADKFEKQREKDLKSKDQKVQDAAKAWGNRGEDNHINVTFKPQAQVDADALTAPGYTTQAFVRPGAGADHQPNIQAEFSESLGGSSLGQVIAHEGSHIEDDMSFLNSYSGSTGKYNPGLNFTHFDTEFQAFEAGSGVKSYSEFQRGPKGYQQLEDYIYRAYPNADDLVFPPAVFPQ